MIINKETENSVLDYCKAAANLYYCITVKKLFEIYNLQNEPISETEFSEILENLSDREYHFEFFSKEEIETGKSDEKPIFEKELLCEHLYCLGDFEDYYNLKENMLEIPYRILEKEKFLKYADDFYVEKTPQFISLRAFYRNLPNVTRETADDLAFETVDTLRLFDRDPEFIITRLYELGIKLENPNERTDFMDLSYEVSRTIRLATLKGATLEEIEN